MSIIFVPGQGWVHQGDGGDPYVLGGELDAKRTQDYQQELAEFMSAHGYNENRRYDYTGLFGSAPQGNYTPTFGQGPNSSWGHALQDRLAQRMSGQMSGVGHFENRLKTADRDYTSRIYDRNNAIEEMYRSGYSRQQIRDYLEGNVDRDNFTPDWSDYYRSRREALGPRDKIADAQTLLSGGTLEPEAEFWGDSYFYDRPERDTSNPLEGMLSQPGEASSGSFINAYKKKRAELANRDSVMSLFKDMKEFNQSE